jgi:hypothetical protein
MTQERVLTLSGYQRSQLPDEFQNSAVLSKPFDAEELVRQIERMAPQSPSAASSNSIQEAQYPSEDDGHP